MACCCRRRKNIYYVNEGFGTPASGRYNSKADPVVERNPITTKQSGSSSFPETNATKNGNGTSNANNSLAGTGGRKMAGAQIKKQPTLNGDTFDHTDSRVVIHHIEEIPKPRRSNEPSDGLGLPTGSIARREHVQPLTAEPQETPKYEDTHISTLSVGPTSPSSTSSIEHNTTPPLVTSTPNAQNTVFTESAVIDALATPPPSNLSDPYTTSESTITETTVTTINALEDTTLVESPIQASPAVSENEYNGNIEEVEEVEDRAHNRRRSSGSASSEEENNKHVIFQMNMEDTDAIEVTDFVKDEQDVDAKNEYTTETNLFIGDADEEGNARETGGYISGDTLDAFMVRSDSPTELPPPEEFSRESNIIYSNDYENVDPSASRFIQEEEENDSTNITKTVTTTLRYNEGEGTTRTVTKVTNVQTRSSMSDEQLADAHEINIDDQFINIT